ncbi:AlbA family DNA-binding domain-containing protein [Nocardia sputi]|uniref:AlbA family DNA-binding domain-containing protein n=1 Tax=Nocardia sputi TaxID=2943705 RepID=UPI0020BF4CCF|nr:ATP-binding protein [Nocardia sputi]
MDGRTDPEKLLELLANGAEDRELDYKRYLDLSSGAGMHTVELAKDCAAMADLPRGGYIVVGAEDNGAIAVNASDPLQSFEQVREVFGRGQRPAPQTRMRQRAHQQMRILPRAPGRGRVRQFDPIPLRFLARTVLDDRDIAALGHVAGLAMRPQAQLPDGQGQVLIGAIESELNQLVEQRRCPQTRVVGQPDPAIVHKWLGHPRRCPFPVTRDTLTVQMRPHSLAVDP